MHIIELQVIENKADMCRNAYNPYIEAECIEGTGTVVGPGVNRERLPMPGTFARVACCFTTIASIISRRLQCATRCDHTFFSQAQGDIVVMWKEDDGRSIVVFESLYGQLRARITVAASVASIDNQDDRALECYLLPSDLDAQTCYG